MSKPRFIEKIENNNPKKTTNTMALFSSSIFTAQTATSNVNANANTVSNPTPIVQQVDVMAMMSNLKTTGSAKLSDFATPVTAEQTAPAPAPAPVQQTAPTDAPKARTKSEKKEYVAPKDAAEARQRIEDCIERNTITKEFSGANYIFKGRTYGQQQAFRMLGGTFDKESSLWSVPVSNYDNPAACAEFVKAELDKTAKREERKANARYTDEQMKAYALKCVKSVLGKLTGMSDDSLAAVISKVAI